MYVVCARLDAEVHIWVATSKYMQEFIIVSQHNCMGTVCVSVFYDVDVKFHLKCTIFSPFVEYW